MKALIITNNPRVYDEFSPDKGTGAGKPDIEYHEGMPQTEILRLARNRIHLGAKLVIHPMMGRIKPHETPYKSVFLEVPDEREEAGGSFTTDFTSLQIIEDSIHETEKFINHTYMVKYTDEMLPDLQYIDLLLILSGMEEYR